MSNHLAIATVSAVLRSLLQAAVAKAVTGPPALDLDVATGRPEKWESNGSKARVALFLYQVTPNAAWRNADLPTRRPDDGTAVQRPQAAIDLHYLISFAGDERKQVPERLLGAALAILHAQPLLSREMIRRLVNPPEPPPDDRLGYLAGSDLADQVELIRLVPLPMSLDELSKLWSVFFQIPYHLSVAWQASVVLLDVETPSERALPVLSRTVAADPFRRPVVDSVTAEGGPGQPIVLGSRLTVRGRGLAGGAVRLGAAELAVESVTDTEIKVPARAAPGTPLRAGVTGLQVVQKPRGVESNAVPVVLRPLVTGLSVGAASIGTGRTLEATVAPPVGSAQRAALLLNGHGTTTGALLLSALPRTADGAVLVFPLPAEARGTYLARVQVDGAESPLTQDADGFFSGPLVTLS